MQGAQSVEIQHGGSLKLDPKSTAVLNQIIKNYSLVLKCHRAQIITMKNPLVDWALLVVPGLIWGASFLFIAEGLGAMEPNGVTFTRIAVGFLTLSLFPSARKPVARADWAGTAWLGVLWLAFPLSMFPFAEQHVSSALTGMLNGATPLFVAAVASLIAHQLPERGISAGLAVGFFGAVLIALPSVDAAGGTSGQTLG